MTPRFGRFTVPGVVLASLCLPGPAQAKPPDGLTEKQVSVAVPAGTLRGTLWVPTGKGPFPGVVIIAGSGATDRDGNQGRLKNDSLKMLAAALGRAGIATLRFDKRSIGASRMRTTHEAQMRFDHFVGDAVRWIKRLKAAPTVGKVFVAGHSQGALVATLAAQRTAVAGVILLAGPGEAIGATLRKQLVAAPNMPHGLLDHALKIIAALEKGRRVSKVDPRLLSLFRPSVQPFLISWMKHDPAAALKALKAPALIIQGDRDLQVKVADAQLLKAARPDAKLVIIRGMNHILKFPKGFGRLANLRAYNDPSLPLAKGVAEAIAAFVTAAR